MGEIDAMTKAWPDVEATKSFSNCVKLCQASALYYGRNENQSPEIHRFLHGPPWEPGAGCVRARFRCKLQINIKSCCWLSNQQVYPTCVCPSVCVCAWMCVRACVPVCLPHLHVGTSFACRRASSLGLRLAKSRQNKNHFFTAVHVSL